MTATHVKQLGWKQLAMRSVMLLIIALLTVGCGPLVEIEMDDPRSGHGINPVLVEYVQEFEEHYGRVIYDLPMIMTENLPSGRAGECRFYRVGRFREIAISWQSWDNLDRNGRRLLIFHELGHCVLNRKHTREKFDSGQPVSIMYPSLQPTIYYYKYAKEYYLEELFKHVQ